MIATYTLATETAIGMKPLRIAPMTLAKAEFWRDELAKAGKTVFVLNLATE